MVSETFEILNEKEHTLHGVIETLHPRKKQPAIIFLNGFLDTKEERVKKEIANELMKAGFVTARFDYTYGFGAGSGDQAKYTLSNAVEDTERVLDHVSRRGYVNPEKILLIGHCFGGMAAILMAAFDERVKGVIAISTPYSFEETRVTRIESREMSRIRLKRYFHLYLDDKEKEVRFDYSFFEDGNKKDMARAVRNLRQPTLLIHGSNDESIPLEDVQEIADRAPGLKAFNIIEGMSHHPGKKDVKTLVDLTENFLNEYL